MVLLAALLMFLVASIVGVLGLLFILFGGLLLFFLLAWILGIVGLILLIVGLVSPSYLEKAAVAQMVASTAPPPAFPSSPLPAAPPVEPQGIAAADTQEEGGPAK